MTTLSYHSFETYPTEAKLNSSGGYRSKLEDMDEHKFVGVSFKKETILTGVATQGYGDPELQEWVTEYVVKFIREDTGEGEVEEFILDRHGKPKVTVRFVSVPGIITCVQ